MHRLGFAALFLCLALTACSPAGAQPPNDVTAPVAHLQATIAEVVMPAITETREAIAQVVPAPATLPAERDSLAARLIIRWEVTSAAVYTRKYQGVIWPGGASGPTWGIGADGGQMTRSEIRSDWQAHPQVARLETTVGIAGTEARDRVRDGEWRDIRTPYVLAEQVFTDVALPEYTAAARRALGPGFDALDPGSRAALKSLGYNRGWSFTGDRRREMRVIRDDCVPAADSQCIARELRSMCRLWPDQAGLCNRRFDEAAVALGS